MMTEKTGTQNVYSMLRYCLNRQACRKALVSLHFGDTWTEDLCSGMCDNCELMRKATMSTDSPAPFKVIDARPLLEDILKILNHGENIEQRITALKLIDSLFGKGETKLRLSQIKAPRYSRNMCEAVVAYLLLDGYISEEFHFTPYSTISYLVPGSKLAEDGTVINYTVACFSPTDYPVSKASKSAASNSKDVINEKCETKTKPTKNSEKATTSSKQDEKESKSSRKAKTKDKNGVPNSKSDSKTNNPTSSNSNKKQFTFITKKKKDVGEPEEKKLKRDVIWIDSDTD